MMKTNFPLLVWLVSLTFLVYISSIRFIEELKPIHKWAVIGVIILMCISALIVITDDSEEKHK